MKTKIALFMKDLDGGGIQKVFLQLAMTLVARGYGIDLLVCHASGPLRKRIPPEINVIELSRTSNLHARIAVLQADSSGFMDLLRPVLVSRKISEALEYMPSLASYMHQHAPEALLSGGSYVNITAILAKKLSRSDTRIVVSEHIDLVHLYLSMSRKAGKWRHKFLGQLIRRYYMYADTVIAVSSGTADSLAKFASIPRQRIQTIFNPAIPADLDQKKNEPLDHPWFCDDKIPVILAVGRYDQQKDFPTLMRAFARVREKRQVRLVILGDALNPHKDHDYRQKLIDLPAELGIEHDVLLPGFKENPYHYMAHASMLVVSSIYEGFGNVIAEALACGCPVVSTDCPSGPAEILENGQYGTLVPVSDPEALAQAIINMLDSTPDTSKLQARGQFFSIRDISKQYENVLLGREPDAGQVAATGSDG